MSINDDTLQKTGNFNFHISYSGPLGGANKDIKVDMLRHNYPLLYPIQQVNRLHIFSLEDIAAMKLNAIANRGSKKDFYDIHALLSRFSMKELLTFFEKKYQQLNSYTVVKSLVYFDDADLDIWDACRPELVTALGVAIDDAILDSLVICHFKSFDKKIATKRNASNCRTKSKRIIFFSLFVFKTTSRAYSST